MSRNWLFDSAKRNPRGRRRTLAGRDRRLRPIVIEPLEDRALLSTYTVNDLADTAGSSTDVTLRYAITEGDANSGSTIDFSVTGTIALSSTLPAISASVTFNGPGASSLTIQGGGTLSNFNILTVSSGVVSLSGLTLADAYVNGLAGGIDNDGNLAVTDCTFSDNNSYTEYGGGGGILNNTNGTLTVTSSTFSGNSSSFFGGGILNYGKLTVSDSTFSGNSAQLGGGIDNFNALTVTDSTFSGNSASSYGGGIYNNTGDSVTVGNTIIAGDTASIGPDVYGPVASKGNNLFGNTNGMSGSISSDLTGKAANLGPLAYNGGPTATMALLTGSPALNAGNNALIPAGQIYDQRGPGYGRIVNGTVDIGAFEVPPVYTVTDLHDTAGSSSDVTLRYAITHADANPNSTSTIDFNVTGTIALGSDLPALSANVIINGPGASSLTISGGNDDAILSSTLSNVTVSVSGLTLANAYVSGGGGAIDNDGTLTVTGCTIADNTASGGGGIRNSGTLTVTDSTIADNTASDGGGGGIDNSGTLTVTDSTIADNTASDGDGGGIDNSGTLTVTDSTFSGNSAYYFGGGIFSDGGTLTVGNTIIAGDTAGVGGPDVYGPITSVGHNLFGYTSGMSGYISSDVTGKAADLGPLSYNGGPTETMALLPGSPAINAGNNSVTAGVTFDQRGTGFPRIVGGTVDIGAFEVDTTTAVTSSAANNTSVYGQDATFTATVTPAVAGNPTGTVQFYLGGVADGSPVSLSGGQAVWNAGSALNVATDQVTAVYSGGNFDSSGSATLSYTVTAAPLTVTGSGTQVYGGSGQTLSANYSGFVLGQGSSVLSGTLAFSTTTTNSSNAGTYTGAVTPSGLTSTNYAITFAKGNMVVTAAPLTVTSNAASRLYGGADPTYTATISGFVLGQSLGTSGVTGAASLSSNDSASSPMGSYTITPTIGTLAAANYAFTTFATATLSVTPATLTITANNESKLYGTSFTPVGSSQFTSSGLVNGDTVTSVTLSSSGYAATATIGTYDIAPSAAIGSGLGNYTIGYVDGTIAVAPAKPIVATAATTSVSTTSATLNASVNPDGSTTTAVFQYSTSPAFTPTVASSIGSGLGDPFGVALDGSGDVFVADTGNNAVEEVLPNGTVTPIGSGFSAPYGVAVDAAGDVFVADTGNSALEEVMPNGSVTTIDSGNEYPYDIAVDAAGDLFVVGYGNDAVDEVMPDGTITTIGSGLSNPTAVAVDAAGDVFVADYDNNAVKEVLPDGTITTIGSGFNHPEGVAVDAAGDVFVADTDNGAVKEVLPDGTITTIGSGYHFPQGVAVDAAGDLFVSEYYNDQLIELSPPTVAATPAALTGTTTTAVSAALTGLAPGTAYYVRAVATSAAGSVVDPRNPPESFTTLSTTTTTIAALEVTYGESGTVTVTESSSSGTPTGSVTISVNGGAAQSQTLSGGTASFSIIDPAAGSYALNVNFAAQGIYAASSATGTLTVDKAPLTVAIINDPTKTYDGTTSATLTPADFNLSGLVSGQSFTVTQTEGSYNSPNVTSEATVTALLSASDFTPSAGTLASNYTFPTIASGTGSITSIPTPTPSPTGTAPPPTIPMIIGETALFARSLKRGRPSGPSKLEGYELLFNAPLALANAIDVNNYQIGATKSKKVKKKTTTIFTPITAFTVGYSAGTNSVSLIFAGKQTFKTGGRLTVQGTAPSGIESTTGGYLPANVVLDISPGGNSIS
jgi:hypothetical protein